MPASDPLSLRAPLESVMREAGGLARAIAARTFRHWTKGVDNSPVSEADIAVNDLLRGRLSLLAPAAGWISEETEVPVAPTARSVWIVDPIDGTRSYIAGRSDWTISVALVAEGRPLLAAIYVPVKEEMFLAITGRGATFNGAAIHASGGGTLAGARFAGPKRFLHRIEDLAPIKVEPRVHSLALRLARVAQGELDVAFASGGSHDWDLAAADLLLHEAGAVLTDFAGRSLRYNRPPGAHGALIAAGHSRHQALVELVCDRAAEFA